MTPLTTPPSLNGRFSSVHRGFEEAGDATPKPLEHETDGFGL